MDVSLGKLQQLLCVARHGSFSRAAEELYISQPALSRSVAALEERYGLALFNRVGHGVELTAAGAQVIALAEPLLVSLKVFDGNLRLIGTGKSGELALGITPLLASQFLAKCLADLLRNGSQVRLRTLIRPGDRLLTALKDGVIELIFYPESHIAHLDGIDTELLGAIEPVCIVRSNHPLASLKKVSRSNLARFPWASSQDVPADGDFSSPVGIVCDNYHVVRDAVMQSDIVAICSRKFVAEQLAKGQMTEIIVDDLPMRATGIYMAKLQGRVMSPLALAAKAQIRAYLEAVEA